MNNAIILSGGTGFLGTQTAAGLVNHPERKVYVLVRAEGDEAGLHRLKAAWYPFRDLYEKIGSQFIPVPADLTEENLGMDPEMYETLKQEASMIIHTAAQTGLNSGLFVVALTQGGRQL